MSDLLTYKDYFGTVEYSAKDDCLCGKILGIKSLYMYEGNSLKDLEKDFREMVDAYLSTCKQKGITPEKAYKGSFNVRVSPDIHKAAALFAIKNEITLNSLVEKSLEQFINSESFYDGRIVCENKPAFKSKTQKEYR